MTGGKGARDGPEILTVLLNAQRTSVCAIARDSEPNAASMHPPRAGHHRPNVHTAPFTIGQEAAWCKPSDQESAETGDFGTLNRPTPKTCQAAA